MKIELKNLKCINIGYKYAAGTVHPDNFFSINNLLRDDFKLTNQKEFKRGVRNIYLKNTLSSFF